MKDDFDIGKLKPKGKRINSRAKGDRFELKLVKMFNKHFETTDFQRTPGSGAFATTHTLPDHLQIHGDLITPLDFAYVIEAKGGYNGVDLQGALNLNNELYDFIEQASRDAKKAKKEYLTILGQDRRAILAIVNKEDYIIQHIPSNSTRIQLANGDFLVLLTDLLQAPKELFFTKYRI